MTRSSVPNHPGANQPIDVAIEVAEFEDTVCVSAPKEGADLDVAAPTSRNEKGGDT